MIKVTESGRGILHPHISIELKESVAQEFSIPRLERELTKQLIQLNDDVKNASEEYPDALELEVELFALGTGPFAGNGNRIKNRYIA